jgi:hypothetical protein
MTIPLHQFNEASLVQKLLGFVLRFEMQTSNLQEDGEARHGHDMSCTEYKASSSAASQIFGVVTTFKKGLLSIPRATEVADAPLVGRSLSPFGPADVLSHDSTAQAQGDGGFP